MDPLLLKEVVKNYLEVNYAGIVDYGYCYGCNKIVVTCDNKTGECVRCNKYYCEGCLDEDKASKCIHNEMWCRDCVGTITEQYYECHDECLRSDRVVRQ